MNEIKVKNLPTVEPSKEFVNRLNVQITNKISNERNFDNITYKYAFLLTTIFLILSFSFFTISFYKFSNRTTEVELALQRLSDESIRGKYDLYVYDAENNLMEVKASSRVENDTLKIALEEGVYKIVMTSDIYKSLNVIKFVTKKQYENKK